MLTKEEKRKKLKEYHLEYYKRPEVIERRKQWFKEYRKNKEVLEKHIRQVYRYQNSGKAQERKDLIYTKLKIEVYNLLGGIKCKKCGATNIRILTINHKNGVKSPRFDRGRELLYSIINGRRETSDLEILCYNCNILYEYERGNRSDKILLHPEIQEIYKDI